MLTVAEYQTVVKKLLDLDFSTVSYLVSRNIVAVAMATICAIRSQPYTNFKICQVFKPLYSEKTVCCIIDGTHKTARTYHKARCQMPVAAYKKLYEFVTVVHRNFFKEYSLEQWLELPVFARKNSKQIKNFNGTIRRGFKSLLNRSIGSQAARRFLANYSTKVTQEDYANAMLHSLQTAVTHYKQNKASDFFTSKNLL